MSVELGHLCGARRSDARHQHGCSPNSLKPQVQPSSPLQVEVTTADDIRQLDALGADAQVGMALYTKRLDLAEAFAAR